MLKSIKKDVFTGDFYLFLTKINSELLKLFLFEIGKYQILGLFNRVEIHSYSRENYQQHIHPNSFFKRKEIQIFPELTSQ
jgi:hypothetical protein